jgi:hypothetical protein
VRTRVDLGDSNSHVAQISAMPRQEAARIELRLHPWSAILVMPRLRLHPGRLSSAGGASASSIGFTISAFTLSLVPGVPSTLDAANQDACAAPSVPGRLAGVALLLTKRHRHGLVAPG